MVGMSDRPISASELASFIGAGTDGAVVTFEGRVRARNEDRSVIRLHYEAYGAMANEVLEQIVQEARERTGAGEVAVQHRSGSLTVGEVSVAIVACAPHRSAAFDATRYVIEQIKTRMPIWKLEEYEDGSRRWLDGSPPTGTATAAGSGPGGRA
jgi:molybdopterin synthase catalytic subunit